MGGWRLWGGDGDGVGRGGLADVGVETLLFSCAKGLCVEGFMLGTLVLIAYNGKMA